MRRPGPLYAIEAGRLRRIEAHFARLARCTLLATDHEADLLRNIAPQAAGVSKSFEVDDKDANRWINQGTDAIGKMIKDGSSVASYSVREGQWLTIGHPQGYRAAFLAAMRLEESGFWDEPNVRTLPLQPSVARARRLAPPRGRGPFLGRRPGRSGEGRRSGRRGRPAAVAPARESPGRRRRRRR